MNFNLSDEQKQLADAIHRFIDKSYDFETRRKNIKSASGHGDAAWGALVELGLTDAFREFEQEEKSFSWWDYRQFAFRRNAGARIDHVLLSAALKPYCEACIIDKTPRRNEQPSDHAPVVAALDFSLAKA